MYGDHTEEYYGAHLKAYGHLIIILNICLIFKVKYYYLSATSTNRLNPLVSVNVVDKTCE